LISSPAESTNRANQIFVRKTKGRVSLASERCASQNTYANQGEWEMKFNNRIIVCIGKFSICVLSDATDDLSKQILAGKAPVREAQSLLAMTAPDVGLLDLGGNIGLFALPFASAGREVHSFEANPENAALLRDSATANGFKNLTVHECAVSDRTGTISFHPAGPYGSVAGQHTQDKMVIPVKVIRLDDWEQKVGKRIVLKIDIEGSETAALSGMARFLADHDYPPLLVESNKLCLSWFDKTPEDLKVQIRDMGYKIYVTHLSLWRRWTRPFELKAPAEPQSCMLENLLCVRSGDDRVSL
jgi:FkbM family methyltransferase